MTAPIYCLRAIISSGMNREFNVDIDNVADDVVDVHDVNVHTLGIFDPIYIVQ